MAPRFYNTLTRNVEELAPGRPGEVRVYVCGMTPYDYAHVGNARSAVVFDVLTRHLRARGYRVVYVRNITDVDDKIVERARQNSEDPLALSGRMAPIYQSDMRDLGCADPTFEPKVSENIAAIVELVQNLIDRGNAYEVDMPGGTRDVYFAVRSFPGYGKLSRRNLDDLEVGARVEKGESKRDPLDFALWKGCTEAEWGWPSPWGKGRPGWHIECSAMGSKFLGHGFDIHGGGMDLVFPHHENEIAQSEAAHPGEGNFAHVWMHNGFLNIDKDKMSKSLGNVVKPRDVYGTNDPEALRYVFLTAHYRGPLAFDIEKKDEGEKIAFPGVDEAERRVDYLYATLERLDALAAPGDLDAPPKELAPYRAVIEKSLDLVLGALDDDLNTPVALAHTGELAKAANDLCDLVQKRKKDAKLVSEGGKLARLAREALKASLEVLGLLHTPAAAYRDRTRARRLAARGLTAENIEQKLADRATARQNKDFARSDQIRSELAALGVEVADSPTGTTWSMRI
jgi:cysteinyl-tRNA synthetase